MLAHIATLLYAVTAVSLPTGMKVDLPPDTGAPFVSPYDPTISIALSYRGSFAAIMHREPYEGYHKNTVLLVIRGDGTHVVLPAPPNKYVTGDEQNAVEFRSIVLAHDGTPFTTISFQGGNLDSSRTDRVYMWNGTWHDALGDKPLPIDSTNATIAAADAPTQFACNGNYYDTFADLDQARQDPHYEAYQTFLVDGRRLSLGYGSTTAMRKQYVVGYDAGVQSSGGFSSGGPGYPTHALKWTNGLRTLLGPGIAYGVNAWGDTVGDNESIYEHVGTPTLWRRGHVVQLSNASGTAYAIADDGTIVGRVGGYAFIIRGNDSMRKIIRLEKLARPFGWHITSAYAIAGNGRILAIGHRRGAPAHVLLLDPRFE